MKKINIQDVIFDLETHDGVIAVSFRKKEDDIFKCKKVKDLKLTKKDIEDRSLVLDRDDTGGIEIFEIDSDGLISQLPATHVEP